MKAHGTGFRAVRRERQTRPDPDRRGPVAPTERTWNMARTIRPAVESLEDRLTPSGMAGENVNVVALLTNAAAKYTNVAYQNIQKLSALNQSAQAVYQQAQSAGTIPSLASLESALS